MVDDCSVFTESNIVNTEVHCENLREKCFLRCDQSRIVFSDDRTAILYICKVSLKFNQTIISINDNECLPCHQVWK